MSKPIRVVVNRSGGTAKRMGEKLAAAIEAAFAAAGANADLALVEGKSIEQAISNASSLPVVAVGGGDGTQSSAAGILLHCDSALAVLPLGTLNHLAKELGVPTDLTGAADVAVNGTRTTIDLGSVGDVVFVNNASIGLYTRLVRRRDAIKLPKWLATVPAAWGIMRRMKLRPLCIDMGKGEQTIVTPLLFIGNNRYSYQGRSLGKRESLTEGVLSVYAVAPRTVQGLVGFGLRALAGRADPERDFLALGDVEQIVVSGAGMIDVAHDGEVTRMALPLTFRSLPRALTVMVPVDKPPVVTPTTA
ncbi:diacylglycerol kinase family protein [Novosphingobium sp.]|uniref:diacylglycerol/lipid kinase family protein n=1 Tax=Novosphingobium sp. TaxID=1874826 RepID=UPI0025D406AA|nr:diacylglycerol kinase family protein [Novosphingobium sp.]